MLDLCRSMTASGAQIFCGPIMGDSGRLYNGLGQNHVEGMRSLVSCAYVAVHNYTEACLLTGFPYRGQGPSREELDDMLQALAAMSAKSAVVTSVPLEGGHCVVDYENSGARDASESRRFILPYEEMPVRFPGTGDIFSAALMGWCLRGKSLENASARAMSAVRGMIERNVGSQDSFRGIAVEASLDLLDYDQEEWKGSMLVSKLPQCSSFPDRPDTTTSRVAGPPCRLPTSFCSSSVDPILTCLRFFIQ